MFLSDCDGRGASRAERAWDARQAEIDAKSAEIAELRAVLIGLLTDLAFCDQTEIRRFKSYNEARAAVGMMKPNPEKGT